MVSSIQVKGKINDSIVYFENGVEILLIAYFINFPVVKHRGLSFRNSNAADNGYYEKTFDTSVDVSLQTGKLPNGSFIFDIGEVEVASYQEWNGEEPWQIEVLRGLGDAARYEPYIKEPVLWSLKTTDRRTQEVLTIINTHARKDDTVSYARRMGLFFSYVQELLRPFEDQLRAGEQLSQDEVRAAVKDFPFPHDFIDFESRDMVEYNRQIAEKKEEAEEKKREIEKEADRKMYNWFIGIGAVAALLAILAFVLR